MIYALVIKPESVKAWKIHWKVYCRFGKFTLSYITGPRTCGYGGADVCKSWGMNPGRYISGRLRPKVCLERRKLYYFGDTIKKTRLGNKDSNKKTGRRTYGWECSWNGRPLLFRMPGENKWSATWVIFTCSFPFFDSSPSRFSPSLTVGQNTKILKFSLGFHFQWRTGFFRWGFFWGLPFSCVSCEHKSEI